MDYIYGQLNIPHKNKLYEGEKTDFFNTRVCDTFSDDKAISVYFLLNKLIKTLEAIPIRCTDRQYEGEYVRPCSPALLVGSKVLDFRGEHPTYEYEVEDGVMTITNTLYSLRGGVVIIQ